MKFDHEVLRDSYLYVFKNYPEDRVTEFGCIPETTSKDIVLLENAIDIINPTCFDDLVIIWHASRDIEDSIKDRIGIFLNEYKLRRNNQKGNMPDHPFLNGANQYIETYRLLPFREQVLWAIQQVTKCKSKEKYILWWDFVMGRFRTYDQFEPRIPSEIKEKMDERELKDIFEVIHYFADHASLLWISNKIAGEVLMHYFTRHD